VAFARGSFDIMKDRPRSSLWIVNADGSDLRPLLGEARDAASPRWSPDGTRRLYVARGDDASEIFVRWMDTGQEAKLTHLTESPTAGNAYATLAAIWRGADPDLPPLAEVRRR
jgi:Tol biopolymer transport system component